MIFEKGPFRVSRAEDGASGLAFLRDNPDVACVMVDINMPGMTGLDVIAAAREDAALGSLPFLVLTAAGDQQLVARAQTLGARAFITKPFSPNKLYRQVCDVLGVATDGIPVGDG